MLIINSQEERVGGANVGVLGVGGCCSRGSHKGWGRRAHPPLHKAPPPLARAVCALVCLCCGKVQNLSRCCFVLGFYQPIQGHLQHVARLDRYQWKLEVGGRLLVYRESSVS